MFDTLGFRLLRSASLTMLVLAAATAHAEPEPEPLCDVQPGEVAIVGIGMGTDYGSDFIILRNISERGVQLRDCELEVDGEFRNLDGSQFGDEPHLLQPSKDSTIFFGYITEVLYHWIALFPDYESEMDEDPFANRFVPEDFFREPFTVAVPFTGAKFGLYGKDRALLVEASWGELEEGLSPSPLHITPTPNGTHYWYARNQNVVNNPRANAVASNWAELETFERNTDKIWPLPVTIGPRFTDILCGDFTTEDPEECDGQIGCSETCEAEEGRECKEDDSGDVVCDAAPGYECDDTTEPYPCVTVCGDGVITEDEACDDGNTIDGDGCSSSCKVEDGYTCTGEPSTCTKDPSGPVCGNGKIEATETCDDGNTVDGDGCSSHCTVEDGYTCTGEPSTCEKPTTPGTCGNGIVERGEQCDGQKGCNSKCQWVVGTTGGQLGSCSASTGSGGVLGLLVLLLGLALQRRRRAA